MQSDLENEDLFFEPSIFDNSDFGTRKAEHKIYDENEAKTFLSDPFWLKPPVLNDEQITMLYDLAETICSLMQKYNVEIWMDGGTLLGSMRHGGLIPWDDDLDFATFVSNKKTFTTQIIPALKEKDYDAVEWWYNGFRIFHNEGVRLEKHPHCRYPFADLFFVKLSKTDKNLIEYANCRAQLLWPSGLMLGNLRPLALGTFGHLNLPMPNNPKNHLTYLYGEHWSDVVYEDYNHFNSKYYERVYVRLKSFKPALSLHRGADSVISSGTHPV